MTEFFKRKTKQGMVITIAAMTGFGKTYSSNFYGGPDNTYFLDTHPTHSTIETLEMLGQEKIWKIRDWPDVIARTMEFLDIMKKAGKTGVLVMDTASDMVTMVQHHVENSKGIKHVVGFAWGECWRLIMDFLSMVTNAGHDLIMTLMLKRVYVESKNDKGQEVTNWNGEYEPKCWKDLPYHTSVQIQLEKGIWSEKLQKTFAEERIFTRIIKSRWTVPERTKPYLTGPLVRDNLMSQIMLPYDGTTKDCIYEMYALADESVADRKFKHEVESTFGKPANWNKESTKIPDPPKIPVPVPPPALKDQIIAVRNPKGEAILVVKSDITPVVPTPTPPVTTPPAPPTQPSENAPASVSATPATLPPSEPEKTPRKRRSKAEMEAARAGTTLQGVTQFSAKDAKAAEEKRETAPLKVPDQPALFHEDDLNDIDLK